MLCRHEIMLCASKQREEAKAKKATTTKKKRLLFELVNCWCCVDIVVMNYNFLLWHLVVNGAARAHTPSTICERCARRQWIGAVNNGKLENYILFLWRIQSVSLSKRIILFFFCVLVLSLLRFGQRPRGDCLYSDFGSTITVRLVTRAQSVRCRRDIFIRQIHHNNTQYECFIDESRYWFIAVPSSFVLRLFLVSHHITNLLNRFYYPHAARSWQRTIFASDVSSMKKWEFDRNFLVKQQSHCTSTHCHNSQRKAYKFWKKNCLQNLQDQTNAFCPWNKYKIDQSMKCQNNKIDYHIYKYLTVSIGSPCVFELNRNWRLRLLRICADRPCGTKSK